MALIDTTDSILMLGAHEWAFVKPIRKLYYNVTVTAVSDIGRGTYSECGSAWPHWRQTWVTEPILGWNLAVEQSLRNSGLPHHRNLCGELGRFDLDIPIEGLRPIRSRRFERLTTNRNFHVVASDGFCQMSAPPDYDGHKLNYRIFPVWPSEYRPG